MSQSKLTVGQYSLLLFDLKTTHMDFMIRGCYIDFNINDILIHIITRFE